MNLIDTNQVQQVAQTISEAKTQFSPYLPVLAIAAAWFGREIRNFNSWCFAAAEYALAHGGIGWLLLKLIWNPPVVQATGKSPELADKNVGATVAVPPTAHSELPTPHS